VLPLLCTVPDPAVTSGRKEIAVAGAGGGLDQIGHTTHRGAGDLGKPGAYALLGTCAAKGERVENE